MVNRLAFLRQKIEKNEYFKQREILQQSSLKIELSTHSL